MCCGDDEEGAYIFTHVSYSVPTHRLDAVTQLFITVIPKQHPNLYFVYLCIYQDEIPAQTFPHHHDVNEKCRANAQS